MDTIGTNKKDLKKFSITMFVALVIIGTVVFLKNKNGYSWYYLSGGIILSLGMLAAKLLKPVYLAWMRLAFVLSWINTRLILFIIFYFIIAPMGIVMRLFGVDLLDRKINKNGTSYWKKKEKIDFNPLNYERQF
jgi:hypothetical protein